MGTLCPCEIRTSRVRNASSDHASIADVDAYRYHEYGSVGPRLSQEKRRSAPSGEQNMSSDKDEKKKPSATSAVDLGLLEEEDEADVNVWEDNWDDDTVEDDFSVQLRGELQNQG